VPLEPALSCVWTDLCTRLGSAVQVLHLQKTLESLTRVEQPDVDRCKDDARDTPLPAALLSGLCANFELLSQFALDDPDVCKEVQSKPKPQPK
jgi:hypothetical protein